MPNQTLTDERLEALLSQVKAKRALPSPAQRKAIRLASSASVAAVAAACGVSEVTIGRWEKGDRSPSGKHLERYLEVLRVLQDAVV
jgi:transcriptional regulator with XRE-family HTH domain